MGNRSSSVAPQNGEPPDLPGSPPARGGARTRTDINKSGEASISSIFQQRFVPAIRHISAENPWLPLLTPEQLVEINGAFKKFDMNGDGHIDVNEIQTVMSNLGYPKSKEEALKMAAAVDADGNGTIEFDEFIGMIAARMLRTDGVQELGTAFSTLFDDGSGMVPVERIRLLMSSYGSHKLSDDELGALIGMLDVDSSGFVRLEQFRDLECWDLTLPPVGPPGQQTQEVVSLRNARSPPPPPAAAESANSPPRSAAPHEASAEASVGAPPEAPPSSSPSSPPPPAINVHAPLLPPAPEPGAMSCRLPPLPSVASMPPERPDGA